MTKQEIIKEATKKTLNINEGSPLHNAVMNAMDIYNNIELAALRKENEELKAMYKECLEKYIPSEKWDEATNFLSTYGSGLAKDLSEKQI